MTKVLTTTQRIVSASQWCGRILYGKSPRGLQLIYLMLLLSLPTHTVVAKDLRVASYNIHTSKDNSGHFNPPQTLAVMRTLDADIIGLQEVSTELRDKWQETSLDYYAAQLQWYASFGASVQHETHQYGNALLSRYPILSSKNHVLYDPPAWLSAVLPGVHRRTALEAEILVAGNPVYVFVTHLGLLPWERQEAIQKLMVIIDRKEREGLVLVMGDFNEWIEGSNILPILADAFPDMPEAPKTLPVFYPLAALDRIYVKPSQQLQSVTVLNTALSRQSSDHLPVVATITLDAR